MTTPAGPRKQKMNWATLVLGMIVGIIGTLLILMFVVMPMTIGHREDLPFELLYGHLAVDLATKSQAGNTENPLGQSSRAISTGRIAYTGSCAVCHGVSGDGRGAFAKALYPPATNLQERDTQEKSDAQLYWIIKNGLSFTGMPAFGDRYDDARLWSLVAYTRSLGDAKQRKAAVEVPVSTDEQLARADAAGDALQRGAAVYFAQGCNLCHGATGRAPGTLGLRGSRGADDAVRKGKQGMPAYGKDKISEQELADLVEYLRFFARSQG